MRQINPSNLMTVFTNNNGAIIGAGQNPAADSQFEFHSSDAVLVVDAAESDTELTAALGGLQLLNSRFTIAHVVVQNAVSGSWTIGVVQRDGSGAAREFQQAGIFGPAIRGDYNHNGTVDAADYVVWRKTLGQGGSGLTADGNGNQEVDAGDYDVWRANFGQTHGVGGQLQSATVPEPAAGLMMIVALCWFAAHGRSMNAGRSYCAFAACAAAAN
jgi:hypothetical protein